MMTASHPKYDPAQLIRRVCWRMMSGERSHVVVPEAVHAAASAASPTIEEIVEVGNAALRRALADRRK